MELARRGVAISAFALLSAGLCLGQSLGDFARQERERRSKLSKHAAVITNEDLEKDKIFSAGADAEQAQSLGEVARQERERRSKLARHAAVITNEDLGKDKIFSAPDDSDRAAASNTEDSTPPVTTTPAADIPLWGVAEQAGFSLGDYARKLREQRWRHERRSERPPKPPAPSATTSVVIPTQEQSPARGQQRAAASPAEPTLAAPQPHVPPPNGPRLIRVERGDSLWKLARRHFGEGRLWKLLWEANPEIRRPNRLAVGQMLRQPSRELLAPHRGRKAALRVEAARVNHGGHIRQPQRSAGAPVSMVHGSTGVKPIGLPVAGQLQAPPSLPRPVLAPTGR